MKAWIVYQTKNHKANTKSILLFESRESAMRKKEALNRDNQDDSIRYFVGREPLQVK